ncbi:MAG TPA: Eco57I restriction-modification methylase domain-containing protein, partial [Ktedonobacterales bacterium]
NGGLFASDEADHVGQVYLANDLFDPNSEQGLLHFLNRFNFTIEEDTPLESQVALDPEMLGKVFENLLEVEERGKSGTFYTPRAVVAFMCREALSAYLSHAVAELDADHLGWLLDEAEMGEPARDEQTHERLTYRNLSFDMHEAIERALRAVRVLDPAVGSGAFPLGMLALMVGVRRALYRIRENAIEPHARLLEDWKRAYIRDCLYGVDIRQEAIEIARLRLWLSLVVDADPFTMEPLPNLDYKLMGGDSLIETLDGVEIYPTHPAGALAQVSLLGDEERHELIARLKALQTRYFQPGDGDDRARLKRDIRATETRLVEATLGDRERDERTRLEANLHKQANLRGATVLRELVTEQVTLTRSIEATEATKADLAAGKPLPFFLYRLHFASVFEEQGGFDIVIANPPYVRHEKIAPATLTALKAAYPGVAHGMADLYTYFYARALDLLRAGGSLCFISSNKFFRTGYGKKLRETLASETSVRVVIDFGDFPVFDAAAYPCIV